MQSEAGAAGAVHGSLATGALTTTFTASQGLLLMIPNMYKIAAELLPGVFHVSARALSGHALSIFGDHSDVMATRQTGFAACCRGCSGSYGFSRSGPFGCHKGKNSFYKFFRWFQNFSRNAKIEVIEYDEFANLVDWDAIKKFRVSGLNPERPCLRGSAQNPDIYFQAKEVSNSFYTPIPDIVNDYMKEITKLTGRGLCPIHILWCRRCGKYYHCNGVRNIYDRRGNRLLNAKGEN